VPRRGLWRLQGGVGNGGGFGTGEEEGRLEVGDDSDMWGRGVRRVKGKKEKNGSGRFDGPKCFGTGLPRSTSLFFHFFFFLFIHFCFHIFFISFAI
jgi:hypothetical protein